MFNLREKNTNNNTNNNTNDIISQNIDNDISYNNKKKNKSEKKEYTLEEKQELIKNTIVIPKDEWMRLEPGIFISYDKLDGTFVKGGYIQVINKSKSNREYFRIVFSQNDLSKGYTLYLDQVKTIYKKIDETSYYELRAIREAYDIVINKLQKNIDEQNEYIKQLEINYNNKIEKIESNTKKVLELVKKLHNL